MYPPVQKLRLFCAPAVLALYIYTPNALAEEAEEKSLDLPTVEVTTTAADELGYIELEKEPVVGKLNVPIMDQPFSMSIIDDDFIKSVRDQITEGTSGLFLLTSGAVQDKVADQLKDESIELIASNLTREQEEELMATFAAE